MINQFFNLIYAFYRLFDLFIQALQMFFIIPIVFHLLILNIFIQVVYFIISLIVVNFVNYLLINLFSLIFISMRTCFQLLFY